MCTRGTSQGNLVPDDSIVLPEAGLRVRSPSGLVEVVGLEVHRGESRFAGLTDGLARESRSDPPVLELRMDMELLELRPPRDPRIEPRALERRCPQDDSDDTASDLRHREPAASDVDCVVHEEHRIHAADVRGVVDAEGPKSRSGGLSTRHVAFIPPPLIGECPRARIVVSLARRLETDPSPG